MFAFELLQKIKQPSHIQLPILEAMEYQNIRKCLTVDLLNVKILIKKMFANITVLCVQQGIKAAERTRKGQNLIGLRNSLE